MSVALDDQGEMVPGPRHDQDKAADRGMSSARSDHSAGAAHALRWETLTNPVTGGPLCTAERVIFSRYLSSRDWRPVRLRRKSELSALLVVANPAGLADYGLAPVDVKGELQRARRALGAMPVRTLPGEGPATLNGIAAELRRGCDIFYLVCHGQLKDGEPWLWLEDERGGVSRTAGGELVTRLQELPECPRLLVLASCQGAGTGAGSGGGTGPEAGSEEIGTADRGALAALGPRLAEAGVPAVLAMQGNITMGTLERLMPDIFAALGDPGCSGEIDRALAVARGNLRSRPDWWVPVLYMRLKSGRIWYVPGFAGEQGEFEQWRSICGFVRRGQVVPIVGPDIAEHVYGSLQDLATEMALANGFPLSPYERNDLAKVAQFISTSASVEHARSQVLGGLHARLERRTAALLGGPDTQGLKPRELLQRLLPELLKDPQDPLRVLADLDARVYVSASANPILEAALRAMGKEPIPLVSHWRDEREDTAPFYPDTSPGRPYVHYIFGDLRDPPTWVLTEDDFFDYLIRTSLYHDLIPQVISKALTANSLLFLGFRLDDWRFRILFRMILAKGGSAQLGGFNHVGVQINPDEHSLADVARTKRYLERYFGKTRIDIYWGCAGDFLQALAAQLAALPAQDREPSVAVGAGEW
jgi:hypothetical protein